MFPRCCHVLLLITAWIIIEMSATGDDRPPGISSPLPGVALTMVAEHPSLATPTGIDVDAQGRIWVVATHTHFRPDDYVGPEHDEILIFEDRDGDGTTESRHVFYCATDATMDLELGPDGRVFLAERDRILRLTDTTDDGSADLEEDLVTLATEADYPHNGLEGLAWHPDGRLIFALGENFAKPWVLTGSDGRQLSGTGEGGVFSCTADGAELHRIARGFWNPFGICVRQDGAIFAADNDPGERPPCRLLHVIEGGDYGYQRAYGSEAHHPFVAWNGELPGTLPMVHPSGEAPCGVTPLGQGLLVPSWSDHRIDFFRLKPHGASYSADRIQLVHGGRYFRPGCIAAAGDQTSGPFTWYLTDWVDGRYQSHGFGRLWKLTVTPEEADWLGPLSLNPPTDNAKTVRSLTEDKHQHTTQQLLTLADDPDPFVARSALNALARQSGSWDTADVLQWPSDNRAHAVLALSIARANPESWIEPLLSDSDLNVRFETLRWIADAELHDWLPQVEQMLNGPQTDYRLFEAQIAAWSLLTGRAESGLRQTELLLQRVRDSNSPPELRAFALRLLPTQPRAAPQDGRQPVTQLPEGLTRQLLEELLAVRHPVLSLEAVRTLAGNPIDSRDLLAAVAQDPHRDARLRAEAIAGLAAEPEASRDLLLQLTQDPVQAVREEALRALRFLPVKDEEQQALQQAALQHVESEDVFRAVTDPQSLRSDRPAFNDTQAWLDLLDGLSSPVDVQAGERIFHGSRLGKCANCHRHSGRGNVVGPDLSGQSQRGDRVTLLQSILEPSRRMAPEYLPRTMILNDGRTVTGIRLRSWTSEVLRDANGQNISFSRDEVESMIESDVSFMPEGLTDLLTLRELRDLLAFLQTRSDAR